jgi:hypothetical protein
VLEGLARIASSTFNRLDHLGLEQGISDVDLSILRSHHIRHGGLDVALVLRGAKARALTKLPLAQAPLIVTPDEVRFCLDPGWFTQNPVDENRPNASYRERISKR